MLDLKMMAVLVTTIENGEVLIQIKIIISWWQEMISSSFLYIIAAYHIIISYNKFCKMLLLHNTLVPVVETDFSINRFFSKFYFLKFLTHTVVRVHFKPFVIIIKIVYTNNCFLRCVCVCVLLIFINTGFNYF